MAGTLLTLRHNMFPVHDNVVLQDTLTADSYKSCFKIISRYAFRKNLLHKQRGTESSVVITYCRNSLEITVTLFCNF